MTQNTDTTIAVTFSFTGNGFAGFNVGYSYFTMQTFSCSTTGPDKYAVLNSNWCDAGCNTVSQYYDINNICQPCSATCYSCFGQPNFCTGCINSQNRVLSGNTCVCDSNAGYYDDLTSLVCPKCQYSCLTCNGGGNANCLTCASTSFRYKLNNTCPCLIGYYDPITSICSACYYTCQTATCTGTTSTTCATCNAAKGRYITSSFTCLCNTGYYDNATLSEQCATCRYSCLTCTTTNVYCTTCDATAFRVINLTDHTCRCTSGYFDNNVTICATCDSTCLTCSGALTVNCLTCDMLVKRQLSVSSCVCIQRYYDLLKVCTPCHYSCLTCLDNNPTSCITCNSAAFRTIKITTT